MQGVLSIRVLGLGLRVLGFGFKGIFNISILARIRSLITGFRRLESAGLRAFGDVGFAAPGYRCLCLRVSRRAWDLRTESEDRA